MGENQKFSFEFGGYRLDPAEHQLTRDGKVIALTPKAFETLRLLVENAGHLLEKDRLMEMLWADSFVEEGNLADNISARAIIPGGAGELRCARTCYRQRPTYNPA